jgi:hypothetical protein
MQQQLKDRIRLLVRKELLKRGSSIKKHSRKSSRKPSLHKRKHSKSHRALSRKHSRKSSRRASALHKYRKHSKRVSHRASALRKHSRKSHRRASALVAGRKLSRHTRYHSKRASALRKHSRKSYRRASALVAGARKHHGRPRGNNSALIRINEIVRDLQHEPQYKNALRKDLVSEASAMYRQENNLPAKNHKSAKVKASALHRRHSRVHSRRY